MPKSQDTPLISIISPCYNKAAYLHDFFKSILDQTYKNFELIMVDDASTDGSVQICASYAAKDSRIKIITLKENGGPSKARNTGLKAAKGVYIGFVDADDTISPHTYKTAVAAALKYNTDWVLWDTCPPSLNLRPGIYENSKYKKICLDTITGKGIGPSACLSLFKANIMKSNSITFPESIFNNEDHIFVLRYSIKAKNLYYLKDSAFYDYRPVSDSASSKYKPAWPQQAVEVINILFALYKPYGILTYKPYLNVRVLALAFHVILEETHPQNPHTFAQRIIRIKDFFLLAQVQTALGETDLHILKKTQATVLYLARGGHYRAAYFMAWIISKLSKIKRRLKRSIWGVK